MRWTKLLELFVFLSNIFQQIHGIRWLALGNEEPLWHVKDNKLSPSQCNGLRTRLGLPKGQVKICKNNIGLMKHVAKAAHTTQETCGKLFQDRRWNCSTAMLAPNYTADLTTGTREQAFLYALSSAFLGFALAKACSSGWLAFNCSCAPHPRETPGADFKWGGCGDNVRWALKFAKRFTDSSEKRLMMVSGTRKRKRGSSIPTPDLGVVIVGSGSSKFPTKKELAPVNLHNYRAGRKALESSLTTQCHCHGVSGSCSIKICWKKLPLFEDIGKMLQLKYNSAVEVSVLSFGDKKEIQQVRRDAKGLKAEDLVLATKSPDYCLRDDRTGSLGTRGRLCNDTSQGYDSCESMCCGRGYSTKTISITERCHCKFKWCCEVICKTCTRRVKMHYCL